MSAPEETRPPGTAPVSAALVLLAALAGWLSYHSVRTVAVTVFGTAGGSAFPLLLDLGVLVASEYYLITVRANRPMSGFRMLAHVLIGVTIALNVTTAGDARAALFHAVPPALFAALVELRARKMLGDVRAVEGRPDRIPLRLWLTAPVESFTLTLWAARAVSMGEHRAARERYLTARRALRIAVTGRRSRVARRLVRRQLRTGSLDPASLIAATGLDSAAVGIGPDAVLRVALRAALGAEEAHAEPSQDAEPVSPDSPVVVPAPSPAPVWDETPASQGEASEPSQDTESRELTASRAHDVTADDLVEFAQVDASLPPVRVESANGRRTVAAASSPARRQARVTARVGVDRDSAERLYRESVESGAPLTSRVLASLAGVSQSTAARVIARVKAEGGKS